MENNIKDNIKTISKLKEDKAMFWIINSILFILLIIGFFISNYRINSVKFSLNLNIIDINNEIGNLKKENGKLWEVNNNIYYIPDIYNRIIMLKKLKESFDSKIIDSINKINFIFYYIKENDKSLNFNNLKLLYRASRDGDNTKICHELCDNKQNVLIIIKSDIGYIFGGYSKIGFKTSKNWDGEKDNHSFLFSIDLKRIYPAIKDKNTIINSDETYGLCFTGSLYFKDNFFYKSNSFGNYIKEHFNGLEDKFEMNGGKKFFKIKELEVFQLF